MLCGSFTSGTTGVACKNLGRSFIGIEKDPAYFAIAEERIRAAERPSSFDWLAELDGVPQAGGSELAPAVN
jgi:DNA modification methylase